MAKLKLGPGNPGKPKYPGVIKRLTVNKDKSKFDSGEKKDFFDKEKKTYSVKTGKKITKDGPAVKTKVKYEISPAQPGKTEYVPTRAFTNDKSYPETSSPENQAKKAGNPTSEFGRKVEEGYQNAVKNKQETYEVKHEKGTYKFRAGKYVTTPEKPAVYGEKEVVTRPKVEVDEVLSVAKPKKFTYSAKKVDNVKSMFGGKGYPGQKKKNILNKDKMK
jgi:hypothetical protein